MNCLLLLALVSMTESTGKGFCSKKNCLNVSELDDLADLKKVDLCVFLVRSNC